MKVAVVGGGWAGCAAAVALTRAGLGVTLLEAARQPGGRARRLEISVRTPTGAGPLVVDNGQHILIGAYAQTLTLMRSIGVDPERHLLRLPLVLRKPDGRGLSLPDWPAPFDALAGILRAQGWTVGDRLALLAAATGWQLRGFRCPADWSVQRLCRGLPPAVMRDLIEPLTVSALNTPVQDASAAVLLRVLRDALFAQSRGSNLLLPRRDLGTLLPDAAVQWLREQAAQVRLGQRVLTVLPSGGAWLVDGERFDRVVLACPPRETVRLALDSGVADSQWLLSAEALRHEAIATVYAHAPGARLSHPMLALDSDAQRPAQFVFDRGQLEGPPGLLAFVVSAAQGTQQEIEEAVIAQGRKQLALDRLDAWQTIVEKRATFACTPGLRRPGPVIAQGLLACGDYVEGPYPATLEGAVISGLATPGLLGR